VLLLSVFTAEGVLPMAPVSAMIIPFSIRLWNRARGQEVQTLSEHTDLVTTAAFSQNGSLLASGSRDKTVKLWNLSIGQEVQTLKGHIHLVDGSLLVSGSRDNTVREVVPRKLFPGL